jgi:hypothetical protein
LVAPAGGLPNTAGARRQFCDRNRDFTIRVLKAGGAACQFEIAGWFEPDPQAGRERRLRAGEARTA